MNVDIQTVLNKKQMVRIFCSIFQHSIIPFKRTTKIYSIKTYK